jgi:hypothetical protein
MQVPAAMLAQEPYFRALSSLRIHKLNEGDCAHLHQARSTASPIGPPARRRIHVHAGSSCGACSRALFLCLALATNCKEASSLRLTSEFYECVYVCMLCVCEHVHVCVYMCVYVCILCVCLCVCEHTKYNHTRACKHRVPELKRAPLPDTGKRVQYTHLHAHTHA